MTTQEPQEPDPSEDPALAAEIALVQQTAATPPTSSPPPQVSATFAKPVAASTLLGVASNLSAAVAGILTAKTAAGSWPDNFWAVSGYSKDAVMAALNNLEQLAATFQSEYADDIDVLRNPS